MPTDLKVTRDRCIAYFEKIRSRHDRGAHPWKIKAEIDAHRPKWLRGRDARLFNDTLRDYTAELLGVYQLTHPEA